MLNLPKMLLIVLTALELVFSQVIQDGRCPEISPVQSFDVAKYSGKWWGIAAYPQQFQVGGVCGWAEYTLMPHGSVHVKNSMVVGPALVYIEGSAYQPGDDGLLMVSLNFNPTHQEENVAPLRIIATDYHGYSVAFNCFDLPNNTRRVSAWILSKDQSLSEESQAVVTGLMDSIDGLDEELFTYSTIDQNSCAYDYEIEFSEFYGWDRVQ